MLEECWKRDLVYFRLCVCILSAGDHKLRVGYYVVLTLLSWKLCLYIYAIFVWAYCMQPLACGLPLP